MQPNQHQHQRHDSADGNVLPCAPPPTPALICGDQAFSALSTPGQPTLPASILAVAKGLMDFEPRHPDSINYNSNSIIDVAADLASCTSEASLLAILDGFCGGNFQFPAQASHSTLETMWPWLSETELGSAIGDDARGKDVGERTRAMIRAVKKWVDRMLSLPFKKKTAPIVVEVPKTPEEIYQGLYAMQKAALEADAAEAAACRAAQQTQLKQHFADAIRGQAEAKMRGDAQIAHYEGFWAAVVAKLDVVIATTVELDDTDVKVDVDDTDSSNTNVDDKSDSSQACATPAQLQAQPSVTVTDTDAHNAQLRLKGRSARAVGYPRCEWGPSIEMRNASHLSVPVFADVGDGRPAHCPCGTNCFCIDRVLTDVPRKNERVVHPRATRCGGLVVVPRFQVAAAQQQQQCEQQVGAASSSDQQVYHRQSGDCARRATQTWDLESDSDDSSSDDDDLWSDDFYRLPGSDDEFSEREMAQRTLRWIQSVQRRSRGRQ